LRTPFRVDLIKKKISFRLGRGKRKRRRKCKRNSQKEQDRDARRRSVKGEGLQTQWKKKERRVDGVKKGGPGQNKGKKLRGWTG